MPIKLNVKLVQQQYGAVMSEAAISALAFFFIVFSIIELAGAVYTAIALHHIVSQAGRYAVVGQANPGKCRLESIKEIGQKAGMALGLDLSPSEIRVWECASGDLTCSPVGPQTGGAPDKYITIAASRPSLLGRWFPKTLSAKVIMRNEPFVFTGC